MYQIVASDMDGPFLASDHSVPRPNIAALKRLSELGVFFVPASGRGYQSILDSFDPDLLALLEGSFVISYNGAAINQCGVTKPLMTQGLSYETASRLFEWAHTNKVAMHIYTFDGACYCVDINESERSYIKGILDYEDYQGSDIVFLKDRPIAKILFCREGLAEIDKLKAAMPAELLLKTEVSISSERYLEFNAPGVNKGAALRWLAHHLETDLAHCIACGDSLNDLSMIECAGLGVVPANATADVTAIASYHAHASNDDGLIAEIVEKLLT